MQENKNGAVANLCFGLWRSLDPWTDMPVCIAAMVMVRFFLDQLQKFIFIGLSAANWWEKTSQNVHGEILKLSVIKQLNILNGMGHKNSELDI